MHFCRMLETGYTQELKAVQAYLAGEAEVLLRKTLGRRWHRPDCVGSLFHCPVEYKNRGLSVAFRRPP